MSVREALERALTEVLPLSSREHIRNAAEHIRAALADDGWGKGQPMESAPRDGTPILIRQTFAAAGMMYCVVEWTDHGECIETGNTVAGWTPEESGFIGMWDEPECWWPLPTPPEST